MLMVTKEASIIFACENSDVWWLGTWGLIPSEHYFLHDVHWDLIIKTAQLRQMPQPYPNTKVHLQRSSESKWVILYRHSTNMHWIGSWTISHGEAILAELGTGNVTLNQTAALKQCWAAWGMATPSCCPGNERWKSHRQLFRPCWGSSV